MVPGKAPGALCPAPHEGRWALLVFANCAAMSGAQERQSWPRDRNAAIGKSANRKRTSPPSPPKRGRLRSSRERWPRLQRRGTRRRAEGADRQVAAVASRNPLAFVWLHLGAECDLDADIGEAEHGGADFSAQFPFLRCHQLQQKLPQVPQHSCNEE